MHNGQQEIKWAEVQHGSYTKFDDRRIFGKDTDQRMCKQQQDTADADTVNNTHGNSDPHAFPHTLHIAGSVILSGKSSSCHTETHDGQNVKSVDLDICRKSRHGERTIAVDTGLNQNICKRNYGILDGGRYTNLDNTDSNRFMNPDFSQDYFVAFIYTHQIKHTEYGREQLTDICRNRSAGNAHL